ncbi:hypothetical protein F4815DRAFT_463994 [Daldinia loculata]|nr:hypothetical protein F4815DRAFT_463994 [Daldinia loculata]
MSVLTENEIRSLAHDVKSGKPAITEGKHAKHSSFPTTSSGIYAGLSQKALKINEPNFITASSHDYEPFLDSKRHYRSDDRQPTQQSTDIKIKSNTIDLNETYLQPKLGAAKTLGCVEPASRNPLGLAKCINSCQYRCETEPDPITSIFVHIEHDYIYRWRPESTITFNVNRISFPSNGDADHAVKSLEKAASEWNKGKIGIQFEKVADDKPAVFQLVYSSKYDPSQLAYSFLPGYPPEKQRLYVCAPCFNREEPHHEYMANVFCHELGHILGLRHEFADIRNERRWPSLLVGRRNNSSVMNYFEHPSLLCIQEDDYKGVKQLYNPRNSMLCGYIIIDKDPREFERVY